MAHKAHFCIAFSETVHQRFVPSHQGQRQATGQRDVGRVLSRGAIFDCEDQSALGGQRRGRDNLYGKPRQVVGVPLCRVGRVAESSHVLAGDVRALGEEKVSYVEAGRGSVGQLFKQSVGLIRKRIDKRQLMSTLASTTHSEDLRGDWPCFLITRDPRAGGSCYRGRQRHQG